LLKTLVVSIISHDIVIGIWVNEVVWDTGRLVIIPTKKKPGNYRGIMLLEAAYKIFAISREVKQTKSRM